MLVSIPEYTALILGFQNSGRPPSWIWYNVTSDHPRLVFDGPIVLLKLHIDRIYTLQDIAIFIFGGRSGLKLPIHAPFCGVFVGHYPQMNSDIVATPNRTIFGRKHVV